VRCADASSRVRAAAELPQAHQCGGDQQDGHLLPVPVAVGAPETGSSAGSSLDTNRMNKRDGGDFDPISRSFQRPSAVHNRRKLARRARDSGCEW
jgi:hypothetical protein